MSPQMRKMLTIVGIVFGLIFGWYTIKKVFFSFMISHYTPPAVTISSTIATTKTWQSYLSSVGTLTAINGVDVSSEASGVVSQIRFNSGQFVKTGDVLLVLDTDVEQAQLENNQAKLRLAQINYDRDRILQKKNVVSQSTIDTDLSQLQEAQASVNETEAKIRQKTVIAPFSGRVGISQVDLGQYLSAGTAIVTLQSLDPLRVQFSIPEQYLTSLYYQQPVDVSVNMPNSTTIHGSITAINSKVDQATRSVLVEATIPNKNMALYPGMFATINIWLRTQNNVVVLPETSISYSLHGDSVFIIKSEGSKRHPSLTAYRQYVTVGERRNNEVSILKGIQPHDQVITSGQLKLQNGTHVVVDNNEEF